MFNSLLLDSKQTKKRYKKGEDCILTWSYQRMGYANNIGKYHLGRTIGEGTFAKVKLGVDTTNGQHVAIKIIDKQMVLESNLKYQANI